MRSGYQLENANDPQHMADSTRGSASGLVSSIHCWDAAVLENHKMRPHWLRRKSCVPNSSDMLPWLRRHLGRFSLPFFWTFDSHWRGLSRLTPHCLFSFYIHQLDGGVTRWCTPLRGRRLVVTERDRNVLGVPRLQNRVDTFLRSQGPFPPNMVNIVAVFRSGGE